MIWTQGFLSMIVWLAYGWMMRRGQDRLRRKLWNQPQKLLMFGGSFGFILSGMVLLGGLWGVAALRWWTSSGLTPLGWAAVTVVGCLFVHIQVIAAGCMITMIQRGQPRPPRSE